jgi:hypothetical protein
VTTTPDHHIDIINRDAIASCPVSEDPLTGRRKFLLGGGAYFTRAITGWVFNLNGSAVTVSVPSTIAALEARDADLRPVAA